MAGAAARREAAHRGTQRFKSRLRNAKLRHGQASIEDVDYRAARRLDKALFQQLAAGRWIAEHRNLLITGPCGVGKSWLSCALAQRACRDGYTVHYARVPRLFADLELAHGDGRFARLFRMLTKADLLILDDWGPDRLSANQRSMGHRCAIPRRPSRIPQRRGRARRIRRSRNRRQEQKNEQRALRPAHARRCV
jgi:DNA replication protein DnaC